MQRATIKSRQPTCSTSQVGEACLAPGGFICLVSSQVRTADDVELTQVQHDCNPCIVLTFVLLRRSKQNTLLFYISAPSTLTLKLVVFLLLVSATECLLHTEFA